MNFETIVFLLIHAVLAPATAIHALLYKRDSRSAFGWIAVCILFPMAGPFFYVFFGVNRVRGRAQRFHLTHFITNYDRGQLVEKEHPLSPSILPEYRNLATIGQSLSRHVLVPGNDAMVLQNGEEAYPVMLKAIASAESHLFLSSYIIDNDATGKRFRTALIKAADRGVDVRVLIDGVGDYYSFPRASSMLRRTKVDVARFLPPRLFPPTFSINMRNHSKMLIVDDEVAFTGGMNIGNRHLLKEKKNKRPTADVHFALRGPVTGQLRMEFLRYWGFATGNMQVPPERPLPQGGSLVCRTLTDGPDEDLDRLTMLLTAAIGEARSTIHIMTPYFLPPREILGALQAAAIRGVKVIIVLPEKNNLPFVHWAMRNMLWELLFRGIQVVYQPPPFHHGKLFIVDAYYTVIGSTNWDPRSLRLNFELQVEVYGSKFSLGLIRQIEQAAERGRPLTLEEVDSRPFPIRLRDAFFWLFSPYL